MVFDLLKTLNNSIKVYFRNPIIILPFICIFILQLLLQPFSIMVNSNVSNSGALTHYAIFAAYLVFSLVCLSFFFSGAISMSLSKKASFSDFSRGVRSTHKNLVLIAVNILVYFVIFKLISLPLALLISNSLSLEVTIAQGVFLVIYLILLLFSLIFLSFSSFILISERCSMIASIKKSIKFVKSNYFSVVSIFVIFFIINEILAYFLEIQIFSALYVKELIDFIIIYPLLAIILSNFYKSKENKR
jgi:hypothetical protein